MRSLWALLLLALDSSCAGEPIRVPVGAIFTHNDEAAVSALKYSFQLNQNSSNLFVAEVVEEKLEWLDTYQVSRSVCKLLKRGVFAIVSPTTPQTYSILVSYSNNFQVPLVSPYFPEVVPEHTPLFAVSIQPNTLRAVNDLITYYRWHSVVYIYQSEDGAEKLQRLFELGGKERKLDILGIRRITGPDSALAFLGRLDAQHPDTLKNVIIDVEPRLAREIIVEASHWQKSLYHFLLVEPMHDGFWTSQLTEFRRVNITGFRLYDPERELVRKFSTSWRSLNPRIWYGAGTRNIPVMAMLAFDGAELLLEAFTRLYDTHQHVLKNGNKSTNGTRGIDCLQKPAHVWEHGPIVAQYLKQTHVPAGLTGSLKLDPNGQRKQVTLDVIETTPTDYVKAGTWSDMSGLMLVRSPYQPLPDKDSRTANRKKYVITSILARPYLTLKQKATRGHLLNKAQLEGYVKELTDYLAEEMNFDYEVRLVNDKTFAKYNSSIGQWTGIAGELKSGRADMAIGPITITADREKIVDFTRPFQHVGISLMVKKQKQGLEVGPFLFLSAFSMEVWICIAVSYLVFSMLLFILSKFTLPPDRVLSSDLSPSRLGLCASFWFTIGACFLRSSGIYPKSASSRLTSVVWWFFTLVLLALYIANLATILVRGKSGYNLSPSSYPSIESILQEAVKNSYPKIGIIRDSTTLEFFKNSHVSTYKDYWKLAKDNQDLLLSSYADGAEKVRKSNGDFTFLLDSTMNEYINNRYPCDTTMAPGFLDSRGYGIATAKGSPLREELDYALLSLQEKGILTSLYTKWWQEELCKDSSQHRKLSDLYHSALTLHETSGLFYILIGGIVLSTGIAVSEIVFRKKPSYQR